MQQNRKQENNGTQQTRLQFLEHSAKTSLLVLGSTAFMNASCSSTEVKQVRKVRLQSLEETLTALQPFAKDTKYKLAGNWSLNEVFEHCAQSVEYSMTGFPENRSVVIRQTIGKLVKSKFLGQGYMSHNLNDPILGAPALTPAESYQPGLQRLLASIRKFQAFTDELKIHFVFGSATKEEYDKLHAMHIANHLSAIQLL
ncbi:MAG: DUF1569 domain-containing protein [Spirochaetota bacterium]